MTANGALGHHTEYVQLIVMEVSRRDTDIATALHPHMVEVLAKDLMNKPPNATPTDVQVSNTALLLTKK